MEKKKKNREKNPPQKKQIYSNQCRTVAYAEFFYAGGVVREQTSTQRTLRPGGTIIYSYDEQYSVAEFRKKNEENLG